VSSADLDHSPFHRAPQCFGRVSIAANRFDTRAGFERWIAERSKKSPPFSVIDLSEVPSWRPVTADIAAQRKVGKSLRSRGGRQCGCEQNDAG